MKRKRKTNMELLDDLEEAAVSLAFSRDQDCRDEFSRKQINACENDVREARAAILWRLNAK